jgi:hypothetical protein
MAGLSFCLLASFTHRPLYVLMGDAARYCPRLELDGVELTRCLGHPDNFRCSIWVLKNDRRPSRQKQASNSSTDQSGGKRRLVGVIFVPRLGQCLPPTLGDCVVFYTGKSLDVLRATQMRDCAGNPGNVSAMLACGLQFLQQLNFGFVNRARQAEPSIPLI